MLLRMVMILIMTVIMTRIMFMTVNHIGDKSLCTLPDETETGLVWLRDGGGRGQSLETVGHQDQGEF